MRLNHYKRKRIIIVIDREAIVQVHQFCSLGNLRKQITVNAVQRIAMREDELWRRAEVLSEEDGLST